MVTQNFPSKGDKLYLMHREVVVTEVCASFRFVKICYTEGTDEFFVDINALANAPDYTSSVSLELLMKPFGNAR